MTAPNIAPPSKNAAHCPLLSAIPPVVRHLIELGDSLHRHLNASPNKERDQLAIEIDQISGRVLEALPDATTPPEIEFICDSPPNPFSVKILGLLLRESLINTQGIYFNALVTTAQMGRSADYLPTLAALAEMKYIGFIQDHDGWLRLAPSFLQTVLKIPHWLEPTLKALVGHGHKFSDDATL